MKKTLLFTLTLLVFISVRADRQCIDLFVNTTTVTAPVDLFDFYKVPAPPSGEISRRKFYESQPAKTISESFRRLGVEYKELQNQASPRLAAAGYIVPGGGLCGPTCAVNLIHALYEFNGRAKEFNAFETTEAIIDYAQHYGQNARLGIDIPILTNFLKDFGDREARFPMSVRLYSGGYINASLMHVAPKALHIIAVRFQTNYHAMVVLKFDAAHQQIELGDPNDPQHVARTSFHWVKDQNGIDRIKINWDTEIENTGTVEDLIIVEMSYRDFL